MDFSTTAIFLDQYDAARLVFLMYAEGYLSGLAERRHRVEP